MTSNLSNQSIIDESQNGNELITQPLSDAFGGVGKFQYGGGEADDSTSDSSLEEVSPSTAQEKKEGLHTLRSGSMVSTEKERNIILLMLLAQVCSLHDSTPKTFIIHVLSLYERGILDYENIEFLFELGLVPRNIVEMERYESKRILPAITAGEENDDQEWNHPNAILTSLNNSQNVNEPGLHHESGHDGTKDIKVSSPTQSDIIVPFNRHRDNKMQSSVNENEVIHRIEEVSAIREHLERIESLELQNIKEDSLQLLGANLDNNPTASSFYRQQSRHSSSTKSSWSVDHHPLSLSRYNRDFVVKSLLAAGAFGQVFHVTNKIDKNDYAIKRVTFSSKGYDTKQLQLAMREVQCLAQLDHENVVRYYTSWLEPSWMTGGATEVSANKIQLSCSSENENSCTLNDISSLQNNQRWLAKGTEHLLLTGGMKEGNYLPGNIDMESADVIGKVEFNDSNQKAEGSSFSKNVTRDCDWSFASQTHQLDSHGKESVQWNDLHAEKKSTSNDFFSHYLERIDQSEYSEWTMGSQHCNEDSFISENTDFVGDDVDSNFEINEAQALGKRDEILRPQFKDSTPIQSKKRNQNQQKRYKYQICLFIQMQLCGPTTLADWIRQRNKDFPFISIEEKMIEYHNNRAKPALKIFKQIVSGLIHIHSKGIVHRDMKPSNIFLSCLEDAETLKIGDFGLSRILQPHLRTKPVKPIKEINDFTKSNLHEIHDDWHNPLTLGVGTASYASPEQISSDNYSEKADIFSLGLILIELFCSFSSEHERAVMFQKCRSGVVPVWIETTYPEVCSLALWCLNKNPNLRPTASEVKDYQIFKKSNELEIYKSENDKLRSELKNRDQEIEEKEKELIEKDLIIKAQMKYIQKNCKPTKRILGICDEDGRNSSPSCPLCVSED